jgi:hypothetical protein
MAKFEEKDEKLFIDGKEVIRGWESFNGWYWFADFSEAELKSLSPKVWELPPKQNFSTLMRAHFSEDFGYALYNLLLSLA